MFGLSTGQLVVIALVIVAVAVILSRPQPRAYWRETSPMRRASIVLLAVVAIIAVVFAYDRIAAGLPQ